MAQAPTVRQEIAPPSQSGMVGGVGITRQVQRQDTPENVKSPSLTPQLYERPTSGLGEAISSAAQTVTNIAVDYVKERQRLVDEMTSRDAFRNYGVKASKIVDEWNKKPLFDHDSSDVTGSLQADLDRAMNESLSSLKSRKSVIMAQEKMKDSITGTVISASDAYSKRLGTHVLTDIAESHIRTADGAADLTIPASQQNEAYTDMIEWTKRATEGAVPIISPEVGAKIMSQLPAQMKQNNAVASIKRNPALMEQMFQDPNYQPFGKESSPDLHLTNMERIEFAEMARREKEKIEDVVDPQLNYVANDIAKGLMVGEDRGADIARLSTEFSSASPTQMAKAMTVIEEGKQVYTSTVLKAAAELNPKTAKERNAETESVFSSAVNIGSRANMNELLKKFDATDDKPTGKFDPSAATAFILQSAGLDSSVNSKTYRTHRDIQIAHDVPENKVQYISKDRVKRYANDIVGTQDFYKQVEKMNQLYDEYGPEAFEQDRGRLAEEGLEIPQALMLQGPELKSQSERDTLYSALNKMHIYNVNIKDHKDEPSYNETMKAIEAAVIANPSFQNLISSPSINRAKASKALRLYVAAHKVEGESDEALAQDGMNLLFGQFLVDGGATRIGRGGGPTAKLPKTVERDGMSRALDTRAINMLAMGKLADNNVLKNFKPLLGGQPNEEAFWSYARANGNWDTAPEIDGGKNLFLFLPGGVKVMREDATDRGDVNSYLHITEDEMVQASNVLSTIFTNNVSPYVRKVQLMGRYDTSIESGFYDDVVKRVNAVNEAKKRRGDVAFIEGILRGAEGAKVTEQPAPAEPQPIPIKKPGSRRR